MDLGECSKVHDLALRADFEKASESKDYFYDVDACEHLKSFIDDCDRRTELAKKRLAETQEELSAEVTSKAEKVHGLAEAIGKKLAEAEDAGAQGKVDESMKLMEEVEDFRKKKFVAEQEYRNSMPASSYQQQKLRVCEVCSAYLGIHDNDRRLADHFGGKLHLGFIKIREKLGGLLANFEERRTKRREARMAELDGGAAARAAAADSRTRDDRESRDRDRYRGGGGGRDYHDRDYDRDSERRGRRSSRSRSRDRRRRSRSRSRDRHRRSHHHRRERRASRSRSRDRRRRSRSRDSHRRRGRRSRSREDHHHRRRSRTREREDSPKNDV